MRATANIERGGFESTYVRVCIQMRESEREREREKEREGEKCNTNENFNILASTSIQAYATNHIMHSIAADSSNYTRSFGQTAETNKVVRSVRATMLVEAQLPMASYLLGLLAMIKCSICSYQCDN